MARITFDCTSAMKDTMKQLALDDARSLSSWVRQVLYLEIEKLLTDPAVKSKIRP